MNTKIHKIFISLVMILTTFLGLGSAVVGNAAAVAQNNGSIQINAANGVDMQGDTFKAYQMFTAEKVGDNEVNYTLKDEWKPLFKELVGSDVTSSSAREYLSKMSSNSSEIDNFAKKALEFVKENSIQPQGTATADKTTATITNLPYGYYLVVDDNNKAVASSANILVTVDSSETKEVKLKADAPTIDKKIEQDKVVGDYNVGDDVPFTLTSKVPDMKGYDQYYYAIHDTMSAGLTFNKDSVKVTIGGEDYTDFDVQDNGNGKFSIIFGKSTDNNIISLASKAGQEIKVTYTAKLNDKAVVGNPGNPNTVNLEYSNNPNDSSSHHTTPDSTVKVYTFELDVTKTNASNKVLPGAKFQLKDANSKVIKFKKSGDTYIVDPTGDVTELVSDENGKIKVKGLDAGKYTLEETQAPDGYNKLEKPIEFTISATYGGDDHMTLTNLSTDNEAVKGDVNTGSVSTTVVNKTGGLLPETGGRGIIAIALAGIILIGGASYIVYRKRKEA